MESSTATASSRDVGGDGDRGGLFRLRPWESVVVAMVTFPACGGPKSSTTVGETQVHSLSFGTTILYCTVEHRCTVVESQRDRLWSV